MITETAISSNVVRRSMRFLPGGVWIVVTKDKGEVHSIATSLLFSRVRRRHCWQIEGVS